MCAYPWLLCNPLIGGFIISVIPLHKKVEEIGEIVCDFIHFIWREGMPICPFPLGLKIFSAFPVLVDHDTDHPESLELRSFKLGT